jgi:hypothetical protein
MAKATSISATKLSAAVQDAVKAAMEKYRTWKGPCSRTAVI